MTAFYKEFVTTAARIAYSFVGNDIGREVLDLENGNCYKVMAEGAGASKMKMLVGSVTTLQTIPLRLDDFCEVDASGDVGAIAANGGKLASDTTPILRGDAAESWEIAWASSNSDIISMSLSLPVGFDGTRDVTVDLTGYSGTTDAFAASILTSWDGAAQVTDTATGTASATSQNISATIAAADVPDSPRRLTIQIVPAAHTTDTMAISAVRIRHYLA